MSIETRLLKKELLKHEKVVAALASDNKAAHSIEVLLLAEDGNIFQKRDGVLQHQNTNTENYPDILKDFLSDVNKSSSSLINSLLYIKNDPLLQNLLEKKPILVGHVVLIDIESKTVESKTISELSIQYFKWVYKMYKDLYDFLEGSLSDPSGRGELTSKEFDKVRALLGQFLLSSEKRHPIMIGSKVSRTLRKVELSKFSEKFPDAVTAIEFLLGQDDGSMHFVYHSANLYEEKMIDKKSLVNKVGLKKGSQEFISKKSCNMTSKGNSVSYNIDIDLSMGYYIKKAIIQDATKRKILPFMATMKDYLSFDKFMIETERGSAGYDDTHPSVLQNKAKKPFIKSINNLRDAYYRSKVIIQNIEREKGNNFAMNYSSWKVKLASTNVLYGFKGDEQRRLTCKDMLLIILKTTEMISERIFNKARSKSTGDAFLKSVEEEFYIQKMIRNILNHAYSDGSEKKKDKSTSHIYHERATFHTTLRDSITVDFRKDSNGVLNGHAKLLQEDKEGFKELLYAMKNHPYHNYYEFDKDVFSSKSDVDIPYLISFLSKSSNISPATTHRCGLKFRKLGNYKALGIYFSHTKTMGIDFRRGKKSYVHELAHHIDLNSFKNERNKMIHLLRRYFEPLISSRREYFLRDEELIARAGEVALILKASGYSKHKKNTREKGDILSAMKADFLNSLESHYMNTWENYFPNNIYIDVPTLVLNNDLFLIEVVEQYFLSFWSTSVGDNTRLLDAEVNYRVNTNKKYPSSHHSYNYYLCDIYKVKHPEVDVRQYLLWILNLH